MRQDRYGPKADVTHLKRALGIAATPNSRAKTLRGHGPYFRRTVSYADAVRITRALNLDPVDVGI